MDRKSSKQQYAISSIRTWSGLDPHGSRRKPYNAHQVFEQYALATGCRFEDAMRKAADALLAEWKEANKDLVFHKAPDPSILIDKIDKIIAENYK